ncbi:unnamed protein product [Cuscuta campestris]|uniref:Retrotransposon gag domain-containing protein n=1 Tax=Cuscuta campestris TaxID=132261 RepID=A0A484K1M6_9ASTE|nr:unnamed protein product [Cuscuta campestris]
MTDASSTTTELDARVREMGHAMVQMQRDLEYRFERLDAALATIQTAVQEYFAYYETPPEERLRCVTMMLEGQAADWFRWHRNNGLITDWDDFVRKFKLRFDPLHYVDYVGQLAWVRQTGGVMEYQATFEKSFALARELEAKHQAIVHSVGLKSSSWGTNFNRGNPSRAVSEGSAGSVTKPAQNSSGVKTTFKGRESSNTPPIKSLTRAERLEKDAKGLCYNCDQKWHKGHKCGRFILIMGEDDGEEEEPEEAEEIEVAADISSLNRLSLERVAAFRVYVGNGDSLCCTQQCRNVALELQGTTFSVDLYVLQIHGHDVVLGVQWLRGLGHVLHDYEKVTMEFSWGEHTVTLRGNAVVPKQTSLHHLRALHARQEVDAGILLMVAEAEDTEKGESGAFRCSATHEGLPRGIAALLERFDEVFKEPQGLPPHPVPPAFRGSSEFTEIRKTVLWALSGASTDWRGGLSLGITAGVTDTPRVPCLLAAALLWRVTRAGTTRATIRVRAWAALIGASRILAERQVLVRGRPEKQCLVEWTDGGRDDATWEPYDRLHQWFPALHLEDKVASQEEGNVTHGLHGSRKENPNERDSPEGRAKAKQTKGERNLGREKIREPRTRKAPGWHDDYILK